MESEKLTALSEKRRLIQPLLSGTDPADALTGYYALWHDPRRTRLTLQQDNQRRITGFVAVSQTGSDLFRPLVTLRVTDKGSLSSLLHSALEPRRPYHLVVPVTLAPALREHVELARSSLNRIYILDRSRFRPIVNVLVQVVQGADGTPRYQIESHDELVAISGTNWRSPTFAEVYVYVHPSGRGRGWGQSVVSACTSSLLEERLRPLYIVEEDNQASIEIAEGLGYVDTGAREFVSEIRLRASGPEPVTPG